MSFWHQLYFDREDRELLRLVNQVVNNRDEESRTENLLFDTTLHPHGIKVLASTREMSVARAVARLLDSLEAGKAAERLQALRVLYDEVLNSAITTFRRNTARVLIQLMKELVRARDDERRQLMLAHDFRKAATGRPRTVRKMLARYHLVEMPEDWSQLTFDHHVHDANTKGRKNPTHLLMDAWIKGIRYLTIIYYNYINQDAAREVLEAAQILGITVRIGIEFTAPFRGRFIHFVWTPRGFSGAKDFLEFLSEPATDHLMQQGRKVSEWEAKHVFRTLDRWNDVHRRELENTLNAEIPYIEISEFRAFVGTGQPSLHHLAEYIFRSIHPIILERADDIRRQSAACDNESCRQELQDQMKVLENLSVSSVQDTWLTSRANPDIPDPNVPASGKDVPDLLQMPPHMLIDWLSNLHAGHRVTLNLSKLTAIDVLELLWLNQGLITHLELFNLKELFEGNLTHLEEINALQRALNRGSTLQLKHIILDMLQSLEQGEQKEDTADRCDMLRNILRNIPELQGFYSHVPLRTRCGTDSTSRSQRSLGMGLVYPETLEARGQRYFREESGAMRLPLHIDVHHHEIYKPRSCGKVTGKIISLLRSIPGCTHLGFRKQQEWVAHSSTSRVDREGNICTLGGHLPGVHDLKGIAAAEDPNALPPTDYANTRMMSCLKVLVGFIPAVCAFQYTQSWWFLAYFGPLIWFLITGIRNIIQFVVAGKGLRHTNLLHWGDFVDWPRLCDSLMYTGFSVVLLELGFRYCIMEKAFGLTTINSPILVFTVLSAANGLYICSHNIFRGLPKSAAIGNLFRSALSIPVSIFYNFCLTKLLLSCGVPCPALWLDPGAAIISKCASDTVAAWIEGFADRQNNRRMRRWDINGKIKQIFETYTRLELLFPEKDASQMLTSPDKLIADIRKAGSTIDKELIINALDMMHFWLYQPRAQDVLRATIREMPEEERLILAQFQLILNCERDVCQLFVNGLVGRHFSRALAFYLSRHEEYTKVMTRLCMTDRSGRNTPQDRMKDSGQKAA